MKSWVFVFALMVLFIIYFLLTIPIYSGDVKTFYSWAEAILSLGTNGFYEREIVGFYPPNYPPLTVYFLTGGLIIYKWIYALAFFLNSQISFFPSNLIHFLEWENSWYAFLKLPGIFANLLLTVTCYCLLPVIKKDIERRSRLLLTALIAFNPALIYVSLIWGQVDFLPLAFYLLAVLLVLKGKVFSSVIFITLALLSKQNIIIFLPVYLFLIWKKLSYYKLLISILLAFSVFELFFQPFFPVDLLKPVQFYLQSFNSTSDNITDSAFSVWWLLSEGSFISDKNIFYLFSYQIWGYLLTFISLLPAVYCYFRKNRHPQMLFLFLTLIALISFLFLTRLHERHLAPAIIFMLPLLAFGKKYLISFIFLTFFYMVNLYGSMWQPRMALFEWIWSDVNFIKAFILLYCGLTLFVYYQLVRLGIKK